MVYMQRANGVFKLYERNSAKKLYSIDCETLFKGKTVKFNKLKTVKS
jgi:hypothetical protein